MAEENKELDALKNYLRIDGSADDEFLKTQLEVAAEYIHDAVDLTAEMEEIAKIKQFGYAVQILAAHFFENRGDSNQDLPITFKRLLNQVRGKWYVNNRCKPDE